LSVLARALAIHTGHMPHVPTTFITGAAGFIGTELVKLLVTRGHRVVGLAESVDAAAHVRRAGAVAVMGTLLEAGQWQDEAAADWVFHLPAQPAWGLGLSQRRAAAIAADRLAMDAHLLDAVAAGSTRRIVYVADASVYGGAVGQRPITEDEQAAPSTWGRCLAPALDRLEGYIVAGLPIVTALPGWVYGNGSWFRDRVIDPVLAGRHVLQVGTHGPWVSPIHVHDCARALVHLAEYGGIGRRYFLVNSDPVRMHEFVGTFARLANRRLCAWRVPKWIARLVSRSILDDDLHSDAVFSNIRLRGIGFQFRYPTLDQGIEQILGAIDE
jgi:nucleoside-diphosphate-sugar epimerase